MSDDQVPAKKDRTLLQKIFGLGYLRQDEYRASINALNIFFGAIIGVNFSNLQALPPRDYAYILFLTSALVVLILIVSNTRRKVWSAVQLIAALAGYYYLFRVDVLIEGVSDHLLITLAIWAGSALLYEFSPREPEDESADRDA